MDDLRIPSKSPLPPRHLTRAGHSLKRTTTHKELLDSKVSTSKSALPPRHLCRAGQSATGSKMAATQTTSKELLDLKASPMFQKKMSLQTSDLQPKTSRALAGLKTGFMHQRRREISAPNCDKVESKTSIGSSKGRGKQLIGFGSTANSLDTASEHTTDSEDSSSDDDEDCPAVPPRLYLLDPDFTEAIEKLDYSAKVTEKEVDYRREFAGSVRKNPHKVLCDSKGAPRYSDRCTRSSHSVPSHLGSTSNQSDYATPGPPIKRIDLQSSNSPHYHNVSIRRKNPSLPSCHSDNSSGGSGSKTLPRARRCKVTKKQHEDQNPSTHLYGNIGFTSESDLYQPLVSAHAQDPPTIGYAQARQVARHTTESREEQTVRVRATTHRVAPRIKKSISRDSIEH